MNKLNAPDEDRVDDPAGDGIGGWTRLVTARPRLSLLLALLFTVLAVLAGSGVADRLGSGGWEDPAAESSYATDALERQFPASQPNLVLLVDSGQRTVDDPVVAAEARAIAHRLAGEKSITGVTSYWDTAAPALRAKDRHEALIVARIQGDEGAANDALDRLAPHYRGDHGPVEVSLGGQVAVRHELQSTIEEDLLRAEVIALPITLILLIMVFGSAVAALLPLGVGIVAILGTNAVLRGLTEFTDVSVFAQNLTTALGLGLAVDYALFIVRRFREELVVGVTPRSAVGRTLRTAGRTVLFSALTVAVSLAAMMVFPQYFLRSFAYAGIAVVLLAAAAALVVLPAVLVLLGERVNALDVRRLLRRRKETGRGRQAENQKAGGRHKNEESQEAGESVGAAADQAGTRISSDGQGATAAVSGEGWARLARLAMRRAPVFALVTVAGLMVLGLPFLRVEFGTADDRQLPASAESHIVQQHIRDGFTGGPDGAIEIIARTDANSSGAVDQEPGHAVGRTPDTGKNGGTGRDASPVKYKALGTGGPRPSHGANTPTLGSHTVPPRTADLASYSAKVSQLPGVQRVNGPAGAYVRGERVTEAGPSDATRTAEGGAHLTVQPEHEAVAIETQDLVRDIRAQSAPFDASVTGTAAALVDSKDAIADRLPWALGIITLATLVLVFLLTGSVLIPLQAIVLNGLSLTAMFGAMVWVFQDGHLSGPLNFTTTGEIETTIPVLMFCVAFGLSMDYGVFLLSRIKEEYDRTGDHERSVVFGLQRTGGLITAAAVILAVVMVAIGTSRVTNTKMLGIGIALAVLMDAMVVRGLLVPAVMRLTGRATWWAPGPLRRLHRRIGLSEGDAPQQHIAGSRAPQSEVRDPDHAGRR
ncbi:MMPL family transporter [Streptomyces zagrosensis]|uniref:RND superfamily putative drug exporter n=1 Tax=Streptomyces zagrosensis TaxID=1042984 RepID=A0A7W9Q9Q4_9ACTN|nr:MMPL family transporter [Streptomyces zagrosensis]MBB5935077.1 RND superfamily putative drug exporter [Streptomyces zagrosensis]